MRFHILVFSFLVITSSLFAQENTRVPAAETAKYSGKIMLIPFDPKLYMGEFDMKINQQTNWKFEQIREYFRHQLDAQLKLKLQSVFKTVSFYSDSSKMEKDLKYIYNSTTLSYDLVDKPSSPTQQSQTQKGVKNGQIEVEINTDKKFMNTKINNNELLSYLNKKYVSEYFVFINELDFKSVPNSYDLTTDTFQREAVVHYSIIDLSGKIILAGLESARFSSKENVPKKIVADCFSPVASNIAKKFSDKVIPKTPATK